MIKLFVSMLGLLIGFNSANCLAAFPKPWQINFQEAATPIMERFSIFGHYLHVLCFVIVAFVLGLLLFVSIKYSKSNNPIPSKTSHNTMIEVIWTLVPVSIIIVIAVASMRILYYSDRIPESEMTLKVIGHQWYWEYEYPDQGNFVFDSYMIPDNKIQPGQHRLLEVDNRVVLPAKTYVRVLTTAVDVIHSWAVPSFGIKIDAVPGRINETWVYIKEPGIYFGQCSELCGVNHAFMPIAVEVKTKEDFAEWAKQAKQKFAAINNGKSFVSLN